MWLILFGFIAYVLIFALAAGSWQKRKLNLGGRALRSGMTGHEVTRRILEDNGVEVVPVRRAREPELARFEVGRRRLALGSDIHDGTNLFAVLSAAHAAVQALPGTVAEPAGRWRRSVVSFGHTGAGAIIMTLIVVAIFRPIVWRLVLPAWLLLGVLLLLGHLSSLSWEYRLADRAVAELRRLGVIGISEEDDCAALAKALPLRDIRGVGESVRRFLGALLPFKGWR